MCLVPGIPGGGIADTNTLAVLEGLNVSFAELALVSAQVSGVLVNTLFQYFPLLEGSSHKEA